MQIDNTSFDYPVLDLPNVQCAVSKGYKGTLQENRSTALRSLTSTLALRKPQWRFVVQGRKVYVYENNEMLGSIFENQQRDGNPFAIAGHRVDKKVKRGQNLHTKDSKKAVKLVFQNFIPRNLNEKTKEAINDVRNGISTLYSQRHSAFGTSRSMVYAELDGYVEANWDAVQKHVFTKYEGNTPAQERVSEFMAARQNLNSMADISAALTKTSNKGVFITVVDGTYCLSRPGEEVATPYTELPEKYKKQIGMLKLVEDKEAISGMGYRLNANAFFVLETMEVDESDED